MLPVALDVGLQPDIQSVGVKSDLRTMPCEDHGFRSDVHLRLSQTLMVRVVGLILLGAGVSLQFKAQGG